MRFIFVSIFFSYTSWAYQSTYVRNFHNDDAEENYRKAQESLPDYFQNADILKSQFPRPETEPFDINEPFYIAPEGYYSVDQYMLEYRYYIQFDDSESQEKAAYALEKVRAMYPKFGTDEEIIEERTVFVNTRSSLMDEDIDFEAAKRTLCPDPDSYL